ncbi:MAG: hypothetical protein LBB75_08685 [Oscillospiraceae bacterium]|jgi:electron transport complex protein RnfE|nr:hypothetical protein [Oscillospiraceae bacterium]
MPKKKKNPWLAGAALHNPVLVQATGLTAVIVAATTLQGALLVSAVAAAHLVICALLASLMKRAPSWLRVAVYFAVGLAIACPAAYLLGDLMDYLSAFEVQSTLNSALAPLRVFLPLMAVNALTATRCERYAVLHAPGDALRDALSNALGYAAAALLAGGARELLGYGSLWGVQLSRTMRVRGAWMPFGGFLLLGAMAALLKVTLRALSARGIYKGAEKALELAPEDRLERLEKTRQLLIADVKEAEEMKNENAEMRNEEPEEESAEEAAEEETEEEIAEEQPAEDAPKPRMPVEAILREYGLEDGDETLSELAAQPLTEEEKLRLVLELEELLDDFAGPGGGNS